MRKARVIARSKLCTRQPNLRLEDGVREPAAAHIVPMGAFSSREDVIQNAIAECQDILEGSETDLNDAENGFFTSDPTHLGTHTSAFFTFLDQSKGSGVFESKTPDPLSTLLDQQDQVVRTIASGIMLKMVRQCSLFQRICMLRYVTPAAQRSLEVTRPMLAQRPTTQGIDVYDNLNQKIRSKNRSVGDRES